MSVIFYNMTETEIEHSIFYFNGKLNTIKKSCFKCLVFVLPDIFSSYITPAEYKEIGSNIITPGTSDCCVI